MRQRTLIIGGDSKIAACLISLFRKKKEGYILTTRRKNKIKRNSIFLDLLKVKKFIIPKNIQTAIILAGIDGEKNCENQFINAKKINYFSLPFLIKKLIKKKIFVIYISSMSIYNRSSLHGNLRLLAEQKILDRLSASEKKLISIIRPTKIVTLNNSIIKWHDYKKNNGHFENFFQPVLFSSAANFIFNVAKKKYDKIYNLIGKRKIFFFRQKRKDFQKLKKNIINKKIKYKNNFKITKPNLIKIIENKKIKEFIFSNTNE